MNGLKKEENVTWGLCFQVEQELSDHVKILVSPLPPGWPTVSKGEGEDCKVVDTETHSMIMVSRKVGSSHRITRELLKTCVVHLLHLTEEEAEFQKCTVPTLKVWSSSPSTHPKLLVGTQGCKWQKRVSTALHPLCHSCPWDGQSHLTCTPAFLCFSISRLSLKPQEPTLPT